MENIKKHLKEILSEKRYNHSLEVAKVAVELAIKYNVNPEKAEIAGLLHDCGKIFSMKKMLELVNLKKDKEIFYIQPEILHGFAGAIYARNIFKIEDKDILNAIRYHTIGRKNMGILEKIIYISDVIEPGRKFSNLSEIKKLAYENIEESILIELNQKIKQLLEKERLVHPNSIELRNSLILKKYKKYL